MKTNLISRMNQVKGIVTVKLAQKLLLAVAMIALLAGALPTQNALAAPAGGRKTPAPVLGRKTPAPVPGYRKPAPADGRKTPALAPGYRRPAPADGRKTPAIVAQTAYRLIHFIGALKLQALNFLAVSFDKLFNQPLFPRTK